MSYAITKKPLFWGACIALTLVAALFNAHYFFEVLPFINVDVTMNKKQALTCAKDLSKKLNWPTQNYETAITFDQEQEIQFFCELECGGIKTFTSMIQDNMYQPYQWHVRQFKEYEAEEAHISFTPTGKLLAFKRIIPETTLLPNLSIADARILALSEATDLWNMPLTDYKEIEASSKEAPNGRMDHTFTYEHSTQSLGTARYRITLTVSGNTFTCYEPTVKIPEEFERRYQHMRASNTTLASGFHFCFQLLYLLLGGIIGTFFLIRNHRFLTKEALIASGVIAFFSLLNQFNNFPSYLMHYHTTISSNMFFYQFIIGIIISVIYSFFSYILIIGAAEGLGRWAFGGQHQLFKSWSKSAGSSLTILGQTLSGYLLTIIEFALVTIIYFVLTKWCGWWAPADTLINPNILAMPVPFLNPFSTALQAGVIEECMCRAIPLAGAALLGRYFKKERLFIAIAFIAQAIIFGGLHANYAQQPAYFRIVELIVPSFIWGALYLKFGLIIGIITHYLFDLILMAMPILSSQAPDIFIQKIAIIVCALFPLIIIFYRRIQAQKWSELSATERNAQWQPTTIPPIKKEESITEEKSYNLPKKWKQYCSIFSLIFISLFIICTPFIAQRNHLISKNNALTAAHSYLKESVQDFSKWHAYTAINSKLEQEDRCIWQTESQALYNTLLETYLRGNFWIIRFVTFEGDIAQRAEEHKLYVNSTGHVFRHTHLLPENMPFPSLEQSEARGIALDHIEKTYGISSEQLKEISALDTQKPQRKDWVFTFQNTSITLKEAQAHISVTISGNNVTDSHRFIFAPETWIRNDQEKLSHQSNIAIVCLLLTWILCLLFSSSLFKTVLHKLSIWATLGYCSLFISVSFFYIINSLPTLCAYFSTAQPFNNQLFTIILGIFSGSLPRSLLIGLFAAHIPLFIKSSQQTSSKKLFSYGLSLGLISYCILQLISICLPITAPLCSDLSYYNATIPFINLILSTLFPTMRYAIMALIFLVGLKKCIPTTSKYYYVTYLFLFISGFAIVGFFDVSNITSWLVLSLITALLIIFYYRLGLAQDPLLVIPIITAYSFVHVLKETWISNITHMFAWGLLCSIILLICSYYWFAYLKRRISLQQENY